MHLINLRIHISLIRVLQLTLYHLALDESPPLELILLPPLLLVQLRLNSHILWLLLPEFGLLFVLISTQSQHI